MILHFVKHLFLYVRVPSRITCRIPVLVEKCQKVPESWGSAASGVSRKLIKKLLLQWEPNWEDLLILSVNVETEHQSVLCHLVGFPVSDLGKKQRTMPLQLPYQLLAPKTCAKSVKDTVSSKASHESQVKSDIFDSPVINSLSKFVLGQSLCWIRQVKSTDPRGLFVVSESTLEMQLKWEKVAGHQCFVPEHTVSTIFERLSTVTSRDIRCSLCVLGRMSYDEPCYAKAASSTQW